MKPPLVLLGLLCLISCAVPGQEAWAQSPATELTIEAIFAEGGITGRTPETLEWSPDGKKISFVQRDASGEHGELWYVDAANGQKAVLVGETKLASLAPPATKIADERQKEWATRYAVAAYHWAPDSKHLLFDSHGQLWYYGLESGTGVQLTSSPDPSSDPKFSPDGRYVSYVRKHDVWTRALPDGGERQLTHSDSDDTLNGEVDWVYAEELDVRSNYFWSPESRQIVFLQMNEKPVPTYPITDWLPLHPRVEEQKYPKAGDPNPEVRLGVVNGNGGKVRWIDFGEEYKNLYIPRFGWVREGVLYFEVLNRLQNRIELYFADASNGHTRQVLSETSPTWIEVNDDFHVLKSGDRFLWKSWRDGHEQLYLYGFDQQNPLGGEAKQVAQLTRGEFEVFKVNHVDEAAGLVFFTANAEDAKQRQLYSVKLDGSDFRRITQEKGTHQTLFSDDGGQYIDRFTALMTPPRFALCRTAAGPEAADSCQGFWESRSLEQYSVVTPEFLEFKAADGKTRLYGELLLPRQSSGKVPLILNPYGGPGVQRVDDDWAGATALFDQVMAQGGFAVLCVDNRGMSARGREFAAALRSEFGKVELQDQLAALDQVLQRYPQLDSSRVGFWGWSYGGYMTLYAMTHSDRFKAGVAVAPVTDWKLYDSIYTERYMGVPGENEAGYKASSPTTGAANLKGHLLLVHGTSDDNVHFQNSVQMIQAFVKAGVAYDLQVYPNKTHSIAGAEARVHLFHRILAQFERELMLPTPATGTGASQP
ncbi:MAG TPA: S9 family peptidase [Terriglobales bacterium]|nr:S9 family peptidase [Terriglobales bacterium]